MKESNEAHKESNQIPMNFLDLVGKTAEEDKQYAQDSLLHYIHADTKATLAMQEELVNHGKQKKFNIYTLLMYLILPVTLLIVWYYNH